jgi:hypothetical protein
MQQAAARVDLVSTPAFGTRLRPSPSPGDRHKAYQIAATDERGDDEKTRVHGFSWRRSGRLPAHRIRTAGAGKPGAPGLAGPAQGTALEPELPIVDRVTIFRSGQDSATCWTASWPMRTAATTLSQPYLCKRSRGIETLARSKCVRWAIEFVNGMAAISASGYCGKTKVAAGIVGHADLTLGSRVEPVLAALLRRRRSIPRYLLHHDLGRRCVTQRSKVIRCRLGCSPTRRSERALRPSAVSASCSFDALVFHPQLDEVANLAGAFPDTKIVLNHVGWSGRARTPPN